MRFTIIIPVYKVENYLRQCVDSVLCQDYPDFELILVDDGSPDQCPAICDQYAQADQRVRVIHKKNGGLVSARQAGCSIVRGEYVVCVDSDDWLEPDYLSEAEKIIRKYQPEILAFGFIREHKMLGTYHVKNGISEGFYYGAQLSEIHSRTLCAYVDHSFSPCIHNNVWNKIIKKELYIPNQLKVDREICLAEDAACVHLCILNATSIYISQNAYYHYRYSPNSICNTPSTNTFDNLKRVISNFENNLDCTQGNIQNQIDLFALNRILSIMVSKYRAYQIREAFQIFKSEDANKIMAKLRNMKVHMKDPRDKMKIFILRHRLPILHLILWTLYTKLRLNRFLNQNKLKV